MQRVFVDLSVVPHQADNRGHDPVPQQSNMEEAAAERGNIWEYVEKSGHFAILGAPGSGKTTLLKHVAITLAFNQRKDLPGYSRFFSTFEVTRKRSLKTLIFLSRTSSSQAKS